MANGKSDPMASRFAYLWRAPSLQEDVRKDLEMTEAEFGGTYRKGKKNRIQELQRLDDQLARIDLEEQLERTQPVLDVLREVGSMARSLLDARSFRIIDIQSAEVAYRLASVSLRGAEARVEDHALDAVLAELGDLCKDALDTEITRTSICTFDKPVTSSELGQRYGMTKQAVAKRRHKLVNRILELGECRPIESLSTFIDARIRHPKRLVGKPCLQTDDPFVTIALLDTDSDFPAVTDAVAVGIWLASKQHDESRPKGFSREGDLLVLR